MTQLRTPINELSAFLDNQIDPLQRAILAHAVAVQFGDINDKIRTMKTMGNLMATSQGVADMMGRRRLLLEGDAASGARMQVVFSDDSYEWRRSYIDQWRSNTQNLGGDSLFLFDAAPGRNLTIPKVTFKEAVDDIVTRDPRLAFSSIEVREVYSKEHAFALARSSSLKITEKVQAVIGNALSKGIALTESSQLIQAIGGWTKAYADTVFRTNVSTAYAAGRFRLARDPDLAGEFPAFMYDATGDRATRPNHNAGDGAIALTTDFFWNSHAEPNGYN